MDYSGFVTTVREQLADKGRSIKLLNLSAEPESGKSLWENNSGERVETDALTLNALNVPLSSASAFGFKINLSDFRGSVDALFICEIDADNRIETEQFEILRDDSKDYRINYMDIFKPGNTAIMAYIVVSK